MNEREELKAAIKAAVKRLQPYEVEALAAHLAQVGFRKTLDAPKERWVAVTEKPANKTSWTGWLRGKSYDAPETVLYLDGRWIGPHGDVSEIIIAYQPLPPPPTTPAQREGSPPSAHNSRTSR